MNVCSQPMGDLICRPSERKTSGLITTPHLLLLEAGMKKLAIVFAVGAAALLSGSAANAADNTVKAKAATDVTQSSISSTDISSRRRYRHYGYRHYRPYYRSYGYAPRYYESYGYAPRPYYGGYGYGGPSVTFGFGGGGYRGW